MSLSCLSTLPPEPNQCSPLCANDGHAFANTKATIAAISSRTMDDTAPSVRSARVSDQGCRSRWSIYLVEGHPVRADDLVRLGAVLDPADELLDEALRAAACDHPEVAHAAVLAGLRVAQVAGDALVGGRVRAGYEIQRHVADRVLVRLHGLLDQAVGGLRRRAGRHGGRAHEDLLERILRSGCRRAHRQVDRTAEARAWDVAPVTHLAREDRLDGVLVEVRRLVRRVGDDADGVLGDLVEEDAARIGGLRITRRVADRHAPCGDVGDPDVRATLREPELDPARELLDVGLDEGRRERCDGGRPAHRDDGLCGGGARDRDRAGKGGDYDTGAETANARHEDSFDRFVPAAVSARPAGEM